MRSEMTQNSAKNQKQGGEEKEGIDIDNNFMTYHNKPRKGQASTEENVSMIRRSPTAPLLACITAADPLLIIFA
mgnify:CR=1 FL=1